jgi:hypothetical protein
MAEIQSQTYAPQSQASDSDVIRKRDSDVIRKRDSDVTRTSAYPAVRTHTPHRLVVWGGQGSASAHRIADAHPGTGRDQLSDLRRVALLRGLEQRGRVGLQQ